MQVRDPERAGFTLIEVVLAMSILLIGMTTILGLLSFGAALSKTAEQRTGAAMVIESIVADLEENLFPLVLVDGIEVAGPPREIRSRAVPGHPGLAYSVQATPDPHGLPRPGIPLEYRIDVELTSNAAGLRRVTTFSTLLPRQVPFGERLRLRLVEGFEPQESPRTAETRP